MEVPQGSYLEPLCLAWYIKFCTVMCVLNKVRNKIWLTFQIIFLYLTRYKIHNPKFNFCPYYQRRFPKFPNQMVTLLHNYNTHTHTHIQHRTQLVFLFKTPVEAGAWILTASLEIIIYERVDLLKKRTTDHSLIIWCISDNRGEAIKAHMPADQR